MTASLLRRTLPIILAMLLSFGTHAQSVKIDGLSFTAPPNPITKDDMKDIRTSEADWVAIIPYAFSRPGESFVNYAYQGQWWGETPDGVEAQIGYVQELGMKVMLKPHIWVLGQGWAGDFELANDNLWEDWEVHYAEYILHYAHMAERLDVEMLCIGTEFRKSVVQRPHFWRSLCATVRQVYSGKITYAANWDNYEKVDFWDELDYIGIDAYFPLTDVPRPSTEEIMQAWEPFARQLEKFSEKWKKPVLFTEFGYLSVEGAAGKNWELEHNIQACKEDGECQKNAYEALFRTLWKEDWWAGGFFWKWHHNMTPGEKSKRYTPQFKPAMEVIRTWYGKV